MENNEFDKFIKAASKEEQEVPAFLDWGNMNIPVKKKRRVVPFWFFLVYIGVVGAASVWWVVGNRRDASSALTEDAAPFDKGDVGSTGGERGTITVPKHLQRAFYAWLNDGCIDLPNSVENDETAGASTARQHASTAASGPAASNSADLSITASTASAQGVASSADAGSETSFAHPPQGEKNQFANTVHTNDSDAALRTADKAKRDETAPDVPAPVATDQGLQSPADGEHRRLPDENLALMAMRLSQTSLSRPMKLMGELVPLSLPASNARRSFYIGAGMNTYRNLGEANGSTSENFGLASVGQSFSFGWIQPAKRMFNVSLGLSYSGLHHYYEGVQDLGFENDFEAGQRIRRQRFVRHNNRIHLLQLDAGVHSAFSLGTRWDAFVWLRLSPGWNLQSSGRLLLDSRDDVLVLEEAGASRDLIVSASVSAGLNYWLTERTALVFRPSYTRHITAFAVSDKLDAKVQPEVIDLCFGLQFRLTR